MKYKLKDVVCGMDVSLDSKFHEEYEGEAYYFCSRNCLDKFHLHPDDFITNSTEDVVCDSCTTSP